MSFGYLTASDYVMGSYRTLAPLMYPPHVIALGCLYLSSLIFTFELAGAGDDENVRKIFEDDWRSESHHQARLEDLEGIYSTLYFPLTVHLTVTLQRFVTAFSTCSFSPLKAPQRQPLREHPPRHRHILQEQAKSCLSQCPRPPCLLTTG